MSTAADPFAPLERVVAKYRRDVHRLPPGAAPEALTALEGHLNRALPVGLKQFLSRHNGANLFRGALRIRSASDIALASSLAPQVVLFADGPGTQWAWATDRAQRSIFGHWDGDRLVPMHGSFAGWFAGTIGLLDTRVSRPADQHALRFEADPNDVHQRVQAGLLALQQDQLQEARAHLRRATLMAPDHAGAWQLLGDTLARTDRAAARRAWHSALRATKLPLPWPGAPAIDVEVLRPLALAFADPEEWERELTRFLRDQVEDVAEEAEATLVIGAYDALARSLLARGRRRDARDAYADLLARCRTFTWADTPWNALVTLAELETDLGEHDEAEALLRRLRRRGPPELVARGQLVLARIAVSRQEPWAEAILREALSGLEDVDLQVRGRCLSVERALLSDRVDEARRGVGMLKRDWHDRANPRSRARIALMEGDTYRRGNQPSAALAAYEQALSLLGDTSVELRGRVNLRLGDLAADQGDLASAAPYWRSATETFRDQELPVREAWGMLRLARISQRPEPLLNAARQRFAEADHATGIAAIDALCEQPGASLAWHIDRATAQARARHDAQRSRPPWDRADADRPERRLGAHRLAIAASGEGVVDAIAREIDACGRAMRAGRNRALDPPVMRYVAVIDLLAGHMSFSAAQTLLGQLLTRAVEGHAYRALQGAIARSPNAALVDGLLSCIEHPRRHPAPAVAAAAEVLGLRRERAACAALARLAGPDSNPISRKSAIAALGRIGDRSVVSSLVEALAEPALAEQAGLALLLLGDRRGVDFHARALAEGRRDLSGSPGEIVGRYGGPSHLLLLVNATAGSDDAALGALQGLGLMGDPRAVPCLIDGLSSRDRRVVEIAAGALEIITGEPVDIDTPGAKSKWKSWWEAARGQFTPGCRYRAGELFSSELLLRRMEHPEPYLRRTAYDEIVITTGNPMPFDADGPWRVQRTHLGAWCRWWDEARTQLPAGKWYLDGKCID